MSEFIEGLKEDLETIQEDLAKAFRECYQDPPDLSKVHTLLDSVISITNDARNSLLKGMSQV